MPDLTDWTTGVDITAQDVDVNIKTSGGANIIIDKLNQGTYTPRALWIARNDNGVVSPAAPPLNFTNQTIWFGKFFTRMMKGLPNAVYIYCKGDGVTQLYFGMSAYPAIGGELISASVTPGANWDWYLMPYPMVWPYDSMFVYIKGIPAAISVGYDGAAPYDYAASTDSGKTWSAGGARMYFMVQMVVSSQGEIPVSGTITAILLPNESVKHGGVWAQPEYTAKYGVDKNFTAYSGALGGAGVWVDVIDHVVPAGKTFYLCGLSCITLHTGGWEDTHFQRIGVSIQDTTAPVDLVNVGYEGGGAISLNKPMVVPTGHNIRVSIEAQSNLETVISVTIWGYEI